MSGDRVGVVDMPGLLAFGVIGGIATLPFRIWRVVRLYDRPLQRPPMSMTELRRSPSCSFVRLPAEMSLVVTLLVTISR